MLRNSFARWPVTEQSYNGKNYYENQIDASWWKNHPEPISLFAWDLKEGFLAGYDHNLQAGTIHIADRHTVPGAKLWEWGPGARGSMWDTQILTDEDGPYAELMTGAYSDNQPDYSWIRPYETKKFRQFWYPLREIEGVSKANLQAAVHLVEKGNNRAFIGINTSQLFSKSRMELRQSGQLLFSDTIELSPHKPYTKTIPNATVNNDLELSLFDSLGSEIIHYRPSIKTEKSELPDEVQPPKAPKEIQSTEELYLTGLRIKQFHNARINPLDYWLEALERDPKDVRCNTQMGIYHKEKGNYLEAKEFLTTAVERLTSSYTRPRDGEALFHLGMVYLEMGEEEMAEELLHRASWDQAFTSAAFYHIAQISLSKSDVQMAEMQLDRSLTANQLNFNAMQLKARHIAKNR